MSEGQVVENSLYVYAPNTAAPIFFTVAFGLSAVFHIWQCFHYKAVILMGLHAFVALIFTAGYALREYGAQDHYVYNGDNKPTLMVFIMSQVFIFVGPPLLELSNYHVLSRLFYYAPYFSPIPPQYIMSIFGGMMSLVEALNGIGVAFNSNPTGSKQQLGSNLVLAALALQICVVTSFVIIAGIFYYRYHKAKFSFRNVPTLLRVLYFSMFLILVRCIYRIVEHTGNTSIDLSNSAAQSSLSPLLRYEWFFYVFDASIMLLNSFIWNVWHAGRVVPSNKCIYLADNGEMELDTRQMDIPVEYEGEPIHESEEAHSPVADFFSNYIKLVTLGLVSVKKQ